MKISDLSSLVQLGVGLHLGTALLQLYGEFGAQPLIRRISRAKELLSTKNRKTAQAFKFSDDCEDRLETLDGRFEIFKIQLWAEYVKYIKVNGCASIILTGILIAISFDAEQQVECLWWIFAVVSAGLSILPAPITLWLLWRKASKQLTPLRAEADELIATLLKRPRVMSPQSSDGQADDAT